MKVLSVGRDDWWIGYKVMCLKCKAILQLEKGDAVFPSLKATDGTDAPKRGTVACPCCSFVITIEPGKSLP